MREIQVRKPDATTPEPAGRSERPQSEPRYKAGSSPRDVGGLCCFLRQSFGSVSGQTHNAKGRL